jgi:hypothetical protein
MQRNQRNIMKHRIKLIIGSALALALYAGTAQAALLLSGSTTGNFAVPSEGTTIVTNAPDGSFASFRTGVPIAGSFQSGVEFNGADFTNIASGDTFALGSFTYYNGRTLIGTSSHEAIFDFSIALTNPFALNYSLTAITFGVDATINTPEGTNPDHFTASFIQPAPVLIGDTWVTFKINGLPPFLDVKEDTWVTLAEVTVTFLSPIPEPSSYGLFAAAGLIGLVGMRRRARVTPPLLAV